MTTVIKTERGWSGHYCCSDRCQFRRNTLLHRTSDDVRIVVSTVGAQVKHDGDGYFELGLNRVYETMAFHAQFISPYWEADVNHEVYFKSDWSIAPEGVELLTFDMDYRANQMHEAVVEELMSCLVADEPFEKVSDEGEPE